MESTVKINFSQAHAQRLQAERKARLLLYVDSR